MVSVTGAVGTAVEQVQDAVGALKVLRRSGAAGPPHTSEGAPDNGQAREDGTDLRFGGGTRRGRVPGSGCGRRRTRRTDLRRVERERQRAREPPRGLRRRARLGDRSDRPRSPGPADDDERRGKGRLPTGHDEHRIRQDPVRRGRRTREDRRDALRRGVHRPRRCSACRDAPDRDLGRRRASGPRGGGSHPRRHRRRRGGHGDASGTGLVILTSGTTGLPKGGHNVPSCRRSPVPSCSTASRSRSAAPW